MSGYTSRILFRLTKIPSAEKLCLHLQEKQEENHFRMVFLPDKNTIRDIVLLYRKPGKSKATHPTCNKLQEKK